MNNSWNGYGQSDNQNVNYQNKQAIDYYNDPVENEDAEDEAIRKASKKGFVAMRILWTVICLLLVFPSVNVTDSFLLILGYLIGLLLVGNIVIGFFSLLTDIKTELQILNGKF